MHFDLKPFKPDLMAGGLLILGALTAAQANEVRLTASHAWSRPTASAAMPGVVYVTVADHGTPTALTAITTPIAAQAEMHQSLEQNGMMEMLPVRSLPIAPGSPITFSPGGYHIMLTGLTQPLSAGQTFPITLSFADGGRITTTVTVQPMTAGDPASTAGASAAPAGTMSNTMGGMKMSP